MEEKEVAELLEKIQDKDPEVRMKAAQDAGPVGAGAVQKLGLLTASEDKGTAHAADLALRRIVGQATRPGARSEAKAVSAELLQLTSADHGERVRRKALYFLAYVGDDSVVGPVSKLLSDDKMRENARMTLEDIPGRASSKALEEARRTASAEFRPHLEQSLRNRKSSFKTVGMEKQA